jgi:hypothetical protein
MESCYSPYNILLKERFNRTKGIPEETLPACLSAFVGTGWPNQTHLAASRLAFPVKRSNFTISQSVTIRTNLNFQAQRTVKLNPVSNNIRKTTYPQLLRDKGLPAYKGEQAVSVRKRKLAPWVWTQL